MSNTRALAKEAAFKLLQSGQRPTADRVRAAIGQGAQQTILGALDEFWREIGERLSEPRLPDPLVEPVMSLWSQAVGAAAAQWQTERTGFEERLAALESRAQTLAQHLREETDAREQAETRVASADTLIEELQHARAEQTAVQQALRTEVERLTSEAIQTRQSLDAERDARERDQAAWMQQIDAARQATKTALAERETLAKQLHELRETTVRQSLLLAQADERVKELGATLEVRTRECSIAQTQASTAAREAERLDSQLQRAVAVLEEHKAQIQSSEDRSRAVAERLAALQLEREGLLAENRTLRDELGVLRARREEFETSVQRALGQLRQREQTEQPEDERAG
ncbi:DNA-binding protein [Thiocystis violacea]|uniref:DNA-binding protein n=1 Tax=Thiocystis violacea TaxID=13725 RepID=UPI0019055B2D|nr:DNA-binding protein [Thiocystis violacea]MBK1724089.1 hypothetical protein [Thiocystis violacea]